MADYYPLLARALDALPDRSPAMRKAVYERARAALIGQLRSLDPPLAEEDIAVERTALDGAIDRLEATYAPPPPPPEPAVEAPPEPEPIPEPAPPPAPDESLFEAEPPKAAPGLPPAAPADFGLPKPPEPRRREGPPLAIAPRRGKETAGPAENATAKPLPASDAAPAQPPVGEESEAGALRLDAGNGQKRPRVAVVAPGGGRSRILRNAFVGSVLAIVIGLIAVAAFLLRDKPADLQPTGADIAGQQPERADTKFGDRVGGDAAQPSERPAPAQGGSAASERPSAPQPQAKAPVQGDVTVAQRAALIEENVADQNAPPPVTTGRVVWRLDSVSGEQGQPLETAVVATVDIADAGLQLVMTIQRNLDATLPASHTVKLVFTATGAAGEKRSIQDIGLLQAKDDEGGRGSPVSGLPVRVRDNLFLIGLSSLRNDVDRNTDLLLHKNWLDLALKYPSGQRAVLSFEKGGSGTQVMQRAFDQWR